MRKPSIGAREFSPYTGFMMNRINLESVEKLNRQRLVRFVCSLFFVSGLALLGGGCVSTNGYNDYYSDRTYDARGRDFRHSPYHSGGSYYRQPMYNNYPYQGGRSSFQSPHHGGGHNPFHVPAGRYHNMGNPGKWRL
ncbi:hypothetical protein [Leptospira kanakyensis]|uniref:hypothetical protein n=1 Tax=Leptospira kanakyensis TaxID=2484968 RepID=UPI00223D626F|nr:hypothetical protein [Leptospira kanakyensis]MCW7469860.1 hypothetical protein [Leptospira kanakyensis]